MRISHCVGCCICPVWISTNKNERKEYAERDFSNRMHRQTDSHIHFYRAVGRSKHFNGMALASVVMNNTFVLNNDLLLAR